MFQNSGVHCYHYGDEENQVVFWGADVDPRDIILITHDPEVAAWADRTVHIRDGRLFSDEEERAYLAGLARVEEGRGEEGEAAGTSPSSSAAQKNRSRLLGVPCL